MSCLVPDGKSGTFRDALARSIVGLHTLDGSHAVVRVDSPPGFASLAKDHKWLTAPWRVSRCRLHQQTPTKILSLKKLYLNSKRNTYARNQLEALLRNSAWWFHSLFKPSSSLSRSFLGRALDATQRVHQRSNTRQWPAAHCCVAPSSLNQPSVQRKAKGVHSPSSTVIRLQVGDLVYVKSDRGNPHARYRYIIVSTDGEWCFSKKFSGSLLRATSYKVMLAECYSLPLTIPPLPNPSAVPTLDEDECEETNSQPPSCLLPSASPDLVLPHIPDPVPSSAQPIPPDLPGSAIRDSRP